MKAISISSLAVVAVFFLANTASSQTWHPVTNPTLPVQGVGFSVQPPLGEQWLINIDRKSETIRFGKAAPEIIKRNSIVTITATRIKAKGNYIRTLEGLRAEYEDQLRAGSAHETLVKLNFEPYQDKKAGTDCLRVETVREKRDNPNNQGETLTTFGKVCRHTSSTDHYVVVLYSESKPIDSLSVLDDKLRHECDVTVESLKLLPTLSTSKKKAKR